MRAVTIAVWIFLPFVATAADKATLPAEWHGEWVGELILLGAEGKTTKVPLTLRIKPLDGGGGWTWKASYGGDRPTVKDYKLMPGEKPGRFQIDEGGGVVLDARLDGEVMLSTFGVGEIVLTARYELRGRSLHFEVTSARKTGGKLTGEVQSYEITVVQRAELTRPK